jgi:hypothetical protein
MCLGAWSLLGYVKDIDIKAVVTVTLPELPANAKEDFLDVDWDMVAFGRC